MWPQLLLLWFTFHRLIPVHSYAENANEFVCRDFKCVQAVLSPNATTKYDSLELCRLLCGKYGTLWPAPTIEADLGRMAIEILATNIDIVISNVPQSAKPYARAVSKLFLEKLSKRCETGYKQNQLSTKVQIVLNVLSENTILDLDTDESYKLNLRSSGGILQMEINSSSVYGARHGLETAFQLIAKGEVNGKCLLFMITKALIKDRPIFKHRGLLLDTSRHFLTKETIMRTLDGMGSVKLNVLHWHATDSHSFPLAFDKLPHLAEFGAYSPEETYTSRDMKEIIEYAELRGVRVILEIDSPAHAGSGWQFAEKAGLGKLVVCMNEQPWRSLCGQPPCGQMNPANPALYQVLNKMYKEIGEMFNQQFFHMGGDEVNLNCWRNSKEITEYMESQKLPLTREGYMMLWSEFHKKNLAAWDGAVGHNKTQAILWSSDLTDPNKIRSYLDPKRFVIETWTDSSDRLPSLLMEMGYSIIYATLDSWYLDHGFWGNTQYIDWKKSYNNWIPGGEKVLGGEAAMWGELASKGNIDFKVWPRAAAVAERLWTSPDWSWRDAEYRLAMQRDRLIELGIGVDDIQPQWCYLNEGECL